MKLFSSRGMTLIELLVVVAIVSIIAAIGWPSFNREIALNKRKDAIKALTTASNLMEKCRTDQGSYSTCAAGISTTSPDGRYTIIAASVNGGEGYTLKATNNTPDYDTNCQTLTLNNLGQKGAIDNNSNIVSVPTARSCWGD